MAMTAGTRLGHTWGATVPEAVRHVEIVEFLLESLGRKETAPWRS
jgi:hypothetical protein